MGDSPWSNQVVSNVTISTTGAGLFVYQGTPRKGNLILAISAMAGVDAYGNSYTPVLNVTSLTTINSNGLFVYA